MNLLLAVVYDTFAMNEKEKFRKLFMHRREGAQIAFRLLAEPDAQSGELAVSVERFIGMLAFFDRKSNLKDMYLSFKALNTSGSMILSLEEFYHVYEIVQLRWRKKEKNVPWFNNCFAVCKIPLSGARWLVTKKQYQYFIHFTEFLCGLWYFTETFLREAKIFDFDVELNSYFWVSSGFVIFFTVETTFRVIGLGPSKFLQSYWNAFDLFVDFIGAVGLIFHDTNHGLSHFVILRFLSLFRLLQMKRSYRQIFNTITILIPRFVR